MQNERDNVLRILITNLPAIIAIALMSIALKVVLNYSFILSFIVLAIAYVILGIIIETVLEKMSVSNVKRQAETQVNKQVKPKLVDLTDDEPKKQTTRKISTAPYAEHAAERLRKTKLNFNDLLDVSERKEPLNRDENAEHESKVTVINDYSTLLKKVKPKEIEIPVAKTINVAKINEEEIKVEKEAKKSDDIDDFLTETSESFDDFTVKSSDDIEAESKKIQNEIDKRLSVDSKFSLPFKKKKDNTPPETFTFDENINKEQEEEKTINDTTNEIPKNFNLRDETTEVQDDLDEIDEISFEDQNVIEDENDKAVADSELINQLYKPTEIKKKRPFWKRLFR